MLIKLDEGLSRDSDADEDDEDDSSDEEDEGSNKYINASYLNVRYFTHTVGMFTDLFLQETTVLLLMKQ